MYECNNLYLQYLVSDVHISLQFKIQHTKPAISWEFSSNWVVLFFLTIWCIRDAIQVIIYKPSITIMGIKLKPNARFMTKKITISYCYICTSLFTSVHSHHMAISISEHAQPLDHFLFRFKIWKQWGHWMV